MTQVRQQRFDRIAAAVDETVAAVPATLSSSTGRSAAAQAGDVRERDVEAPLAGGRGCTFRLASAAPGASG